MSNQFIPPGISDLAEIDLADVAYQSSWTIVTGLVAPGSGGGWEGKRGVYSVECVSFSAWRIEGNPVVREPLTTLRAVPPEWEGGDYDDYSLLRMRLRLSDGEDRAVVEAILPIDSRDGELETIGEELKRPLVVSTALFGELVLDRRISWFGGRATWNGSSIDVHLDAEEDQISPEALAAAETLWSDQPGWSGRVEQQTVADLLALKNDAWLEDGEKKLSAKEFVRRVRLTSITIRDDGSFEFWHDDGNLFLGHSIMVDGNIDEGPTYAGIHG